MDWQMVVAIVLGTIISRFIVDLILDKDKDKDKESKE